MMMMMGDAVHKWHSQRYKVETVKTTL